MRAAVIGRGRLGQAVAEQLRIRGAEVVLLSRVNGFDVTRPVSLEEHGRLDAVVEATDIFTINAQKARAFFQASTTNVNAAVAQAGIPLHLLISIVNCQDPALAKNGYYAGKAAQEQAAAHAAAPVTTLRSTLWFEFARQNLDRTRIGPFRLVPQMRVQPVALDSVAQIAADRCLGTRSFRVLDVCGPEVMTLWKMTLGLPGSKGVPIPLPVPTRAGRAFRNGTLLPSPEAQIIGPRYSEWLRQKQQSPA
jgi:uncharacterized protein YbjT (DUF2867 family)